LCVKLVLHGLAIYAVMSSITDSYPIVTIVIYNHVYAIFWFHLIKVTVYPAYQWRSRSRITLSDHYTDIAKKMLGRCKTNNGGHIVQMKVKMS